MVKLKLRPVGTSVGVVLPKEVLDQMNLQKGDVVFLTRDESGYRITPYDARFEEQMEAARSVMKRRRAVLRELAK